MTEDIKNKIKEDTKKYLEQIYVSHKDDDVSAWNSLIDLLFIYIDIAIEEHSSKCRQ